MPHHGELSGRTDETATTGSSRSTRSTDSEGEEDLRHYGGAPKSGTGRG
jgi:hypothetical protein